MSGIDSDGSVFGSDIDFSTGSPSPPRAPAPASKAAGTSGAKAAGTSGAKTAAESSRATDSSGFGLSGQPTLEDRIYGRQDYMKEMHHETMMSIFRKHAQKYEQYLSSNDMSMLKSFIQQNFGKIVWLDFLQEKLKEVVEAFATQDQKRMILKYDYNPDTMIKILRMILEDYQRKFALVDLSFEFPGTAEGLSTVVAKTRKKMGDVIAELQATIRDQQDEIALMKDNLLQIPELQSELAAARNHIRYLSQKDKYAVEEPLTREGFMEELQYRLDMQEHLSSTLEDQLEREKMSKNDIMERFLQAETRRLEEHQTKMREIAEATKHLEMRDLIHQEILEKIKTLNPNPDDVGKAVDDWIRTTQEVIEQKKQEIQSTARAMKEITERIVQMQVDTEERETYLHNEKVKLEQKETELNDWKKKCKEEEAKIEKRKKEHQELEAEGYDLLSVVNRLKNQNEGLKESAAWYRGNIHKVTGELRRGTTQGQGVLQTIPEEEEMSPLHFRSIQQRMRRRRRPERRQRWRQYRQAELAEEEPKYQQPVDSSFASTSPDSPSPQRRIPEVTVTPPSAVQPSPYVSEVASPIVTSPSPESEMYRDGESPFRQTYPTATPEMTNFPSSSFECTPIRQSMVLTSPRTAENFLVNIGVDPKPIITVADGECFTCDISLDIQPGGRRSFPQLPHQIEGESPYQLHMPSHMSSSRSRDRTMEMSESPIIKGRRVGRYNVPPPVTPTTDRRYGLFTPRGVFKKRHFNIRRVPGKDPISELPWSPINLSEDATTPLSQLQPAPSPDLSDRSMSFEKSPGGYYHPFASKISEIGYKGAFPVYSAPDFSRSPSPVIKGPTHMYLSPESASPSPIIKGPTRRYPSPESASPSPVIKGPTRRYTSPESASPSPVIKGPTRRYPSPEYYASSAPFAKTLNDIYRASEYERSPSPVIKGPTYWWYKSQDSNYSSASPPLDGRFYGNQSPVIQSALLDTPRSGYQSDFEKSRELQEIRSYDSSSPQYPRYQEDSFGRRLRFDDESKADDLNRRWLPEEMFPSGNISDSSSFGPTNQSFTSGYSPQEMSYQEDPLNRRIQLDEMFESSRTPDYSVSPQMMRTPDKHLSPGGTSGTDSMESERGYLEGSPYGSSLLNESQYFQ